VLREGPGRASRLETYLLARPPHGAFPGVHVFPGGRVDPGDLDAAWEARSSGGDLLLAGLAAYEPDRGRALGHCVAAVREVFEETGLLLAQPAALPPAARLEARAGLLADRFTFADWCHRQDVTLALDRLIPWAHWVTPEAEERRFDTWIFLALAPPDQAASTLAGEVLGGSWVPIRDALVPADGERLPLAPPTLRTLEEIDRIGSWTGVVSAAPRRHLVATLPRLLPGIDPPTLALPGDAAYGSSDPCGVDGPSRFVFLAGRWVSTAGPKNARPAL
jgi:8-oxo-dGTP pyrophosphatase MutT (NUDIX family)